MILYAGTIFVSAFLLFQVQPIVARSILAWFGGSASVWTTCVLFFQVVLVLGYAGAHWLAGRPSRGRAAMVLTILLALSLLCLPISPAEAWKPTGAENPTARILALLAATVGLPYLLLSMTGPLVQAWYARVGAVPYRLFALSNLGSMLGLLAYPALIEPALPTRNQAIAWSAAYLVYAVLCAAAAWRGAARRPIMAPEAGTAADSPEDGPPGAGRRAFWVLLACGPSMMMLALTNHLTQDVAAIPFLWILPLSLYLLTFILCFDAARWYWRPGFLALLPFALGTMTWMLLTERDDVGMKLGIALLAAALWICCMVCHGELARAKPHPRHLTSFYLMVAVGGALGGMFTGLAAPYLFPAYFEFPIAIAICGTLGVIAVLKEAGPFRLHYRLPAGVVVMAGLGTLYAFLWNAIAEPIRDYRLVARNFYGALRVRQNEKDDDWNAYRTLLHGAINHGEQWTHPDRRRELLTYYCADTGVGRAMRLRKAGVPHRVGVLGLGAGTMAAFGRPGDSYRFYEINPMVPRIAATEFTFLKDSPARIEVVLGDARLSMEREPAQQFDMLVMDAFSGDSIPVHLLTREAFRLYFRHLREDGLVAVHISNKYLDLEPVLARAAADLGKAARTVETDDISDGNCFGTTWVLMTSRPEVFRLPAYQGTAAPKSKPGVRAWTDDYSNLFRILK